MVTEFDGDRRHLTEAERKQRNGGQAHGENTGRNRDEVEDSGEGSEDRSEKTETKTWSCLL